MRRLALASMFLTVLLAGTVAANKDYLYRWVRVGTGLKDAADVERVRRIAETAAQHDLTGILFSPRDSIHSMKLPVQADPLRDEVE